MCLAYRYVNKTGWITITITLYLISTSVASAVTTTSTISTVTVVVPIHIWSVMTLSSPTPATTTCSTTVPTRGWWWVLWVWGRGAIELTTRIAIAQPFLMWSVTPITPALSPVMSVTTAAIICLSGPTLLLVSAGLGHGDVPIAVHQGLGDVVHVEGETLGC